MNRNHKAVQGTAHLVVNRCQRRGIDADPTTGKIDLRLQGRQDKTNW